MESGILKQQRAGPKCGEEQSGLWFLRGMWSREIHTGRNFANNAVYDQVCGLSTYYSLNNWHRLCC